MKNVRKVSILVFLMILLINSSCFASTDQFRAFKTWDYEIGNVSETDNTAVNNAVSYGVFTFQKLGYINADGTNTYTTTNDKGYLLNNWIKISGNNYGFYVYAHGGYSGDKIWFNMQKGTEATRVYPSDITGNWHLVFLDSCSVLATNEFATRFKTDGYSNRATLGWFDTVKHVDSADWWSHFYPIAGSTNLRSACLSAADQCGGSTPIRIYGDKTWNGYAW